MTDKDLMQQALDALEVVVVDVKTTPNAYEMQRQATTALRSRLEEPEDDMTIAYMSGFHDGKKAARQALAQPAAWVGLTDGEIKEIIGPWGVTPIKGYTRKLFDQIEAKLKEKNT